MGCSTSSVVPLAESDIDDACGIKVRVNPSTPDQITRNGTKTNGFVLKSSDPPTEILAKGFTKQTNPAPLAFEVPIFDNDQSLIRKHPPKRFRRFGDTVDDQEELTHDTLDERQREAEKRRREILSQRIMSAKTRPRPKPLVHSDAFNQDNGENWERNI